MSTTNELTLVPKIDLTDLADHINRVHGVVVEQARVCGELLIQAKSQVAHGEWEAWIKANCPFSPRTG